MLQQWYDLSDPAMEDALQGPPAFLGEQADAVIAGPRQASARSFGAANWLDHLPPSLLASFAASPAGASRYPIGIKLCSLEA